ncbi:MAG: U32 family peptidase [Clostridia bacterium]|nr:U32 family peptidase [Clostridia bacterium]
MTELLSPAGNFEKMKAAFLYGADAVYLAAKRFGMRAAADNFTLEELSEAAKYAHERGKKIYLTLNTLPREYEYADLADFIRELAALPHKVDAAIVADAGVFALIKEIYPELELHISTQAGVVSSADCNFWYKLGARRAVLAREVSLEEIKQIRKNIPDDMEIEVFVHGSMCVSFSGRCLLSNNLVGRDANRGACAQPCRWNYTIREEKRPDIALPIEEEREGTYIMSSKDMCMVEHMNELIEAGVTSFKIEGRMKSAYYTAVVTNAYRAAIDGYMEKGTDFALDPAWLLELDSVSHREYCTGYFYDDPMNNAQTCTVPGYLREKAYLAVAKEYDAASGRALFIQRNKFCVGDEVELISPGKLGRRFTAGRMANTDGEDIPSVPHPFMEFWLEVPFEVKQGDILRGANR